jgi:hypothetical protein
MKHDQVLSRRSGESAGIPHFTVHTWNFPAIIRLLELFGRFVVMEKSRGKVIIQGTQRLSVGMLLVLASLACLLSATPIGTSGLDNNHATPLARLGPPTAEGLKIVLQRLDVEFLGQDGHRVIGSGCPGNDAKGAVENYHFVISGVDEYRSVSRVVVLGDNSTLTWAWPCSDTWGLEAENYGDGVWEVYIAPSSPASIYTILFIYDDNTMAVGMTASR